MDFTPPSPTNTPSAAVASECCSMVRQFKMGPTDESTPLRGVKRKIGAVALHKKLENVHGACLGTPQFSSTLNESFVRNFDEIVQLDNDEKPYKMFKGDECKKLKVRSAPTTPKKQIKSSDNLRKPSSSFIRSFATASISSPLKESHEILYPTLKPLEPQEKSVTPFKNKKNTPAKKCLFENKDPFKKVVSNRLIMGKIFRNLSNGDLYRLSMVSKDFRKAVEDDARSNSRYQLFKEIHKKNKENYMITPPSSPEKDEEPTGGNSPRSQRFKEYFEAKKDLTLNQSLTKCPACNKPSIVDNFVAQCSSDFCGYIFCQKCNSFAQNPDDFYDKCGNSSLLSNASLNRRRTLEDLSNSHFDLSENSIFSSTRYDSGIGSEVDTTNTPERVKRNLSKSFGSKERPKALFESNQKVVKSIEKKSLQNKCNIVPVVPKIKKKIEVMEPPSPPKVKQHVACSKQSKRNLKRLTR